MRVLDLGCGNGLTPQKLGLDSSWEIVGLDIDFAAVSQAHRRFPQRTFVRSEGARLPFPAASFDQVISNVALPYMDIPRTLEEIWRVLLPGGRVLASLHPMRFTLAEMRNAFPVPRALLYRSWVLANGFIFHIAGRNFGEAFQTERGIRIALRRANFTEISLWHDSKRWFVGATKPSKNGSA
jgi:ubiquinone/menaquinone biosynthesis C-methylase UbiE